MKRTLAIAITVAILATILLTPAVVFAEAISLTGVTGWTAISAANEQNDFLVDQQTGSGSVSQDIVGDATDRSFFSCFDQTAGEIGFRIRVNSQDNNQYPGTAGALPTFTGYVFVGVDIGTAAAPTGDGKIDAFLGLDLHTPSSQLIGLYASNPAKENISPSTTGIGALLYSVPAVRDVTGAVKPNFAFSVAPDSSFSSDPDFFVSYKYSLAELNAAFAANGLSQLQISRDTSLHYIVGTSTQANAFNQDLNGVNKAGMDSSALFADLGMITAEVPLNHAPTGSPVNTATQLGTAVSVTVTAADVDGDTLTYALKAGAGPAHGTVVKNPDGTWKYTPATGFYGTDTFTVTASDGRGGTVDIVVTVSVNAPPAGSPVSATTHLDKPVDITVAATDADGDTLAYSLKDGSGPAHGTAVKNADGTWKYTPDTGCLGSDSFVIHVSDSKGGSIDITVTVTVKPRVISGVLRDSGGQVLGSAIIVVLDARGQVLLATTADEQGQFDLTGLPAGEPVTLKITRPGYEPIQQTVTFTDEPITLVEYTLVPVPVPVTGEAGASAGMLQGAAAILLAAALATLRRRLLQA